MQIDRGASKGCLAGHHQHYEELWLRVTTFQ